MIQLVAAALALAVIGAAGVVGITGVVSAQGGREWVVTDAGDSSRCGGGVCTLRGAIEAANASAGPDRITFALPAGTSIRPGFALPPLSDDGIVIDATASGGDPSLAAAPLIYLDGKRAGDAAGLEIRAADAMVRGLAIGGFARYGIGVVSATASGAAIEYNWIGMSAEGRTASANQLSGVAVLGGAQNARIANNRIAGNSFDGPNGRTGHGVVIGGGGSVGAEIVDNRIGFAAGERPLANDDGVLIVASAQAVVRGNWIGASAVAGIEVRETSQPGTAIEGNWIGVTPTGSEAGNDLGIFLGPGAAATRIGAGGRNVIAANRVGVAIEQGAREAQLIGNWIGVAPSADGSAARLAPNREAGVSVIAGASHIRVQGNRIAVGDVGIAVTGADTSLVSLTNNMIAGGRMGIELRQPVGINVGGGDRALGNAVCGAETAIAASQIAPLGEAEGLTVTNNLIGDAAQSRVDFAECRSTRLGLVLGEGMQGASVSQNGLSGVGQAAIAITGVDARDNRVSKNWFDGNGIDIDLGLDGATLNDEGDDDEGPHDLANYPVIRSVELRRVGPQFIRSTWRGTAEPRSRVELYEVGRRDGSSLTSAQADHRGEWTAISSQLAINAVRALGMTPSGSTSEFSPPFTPTRLQPLSEGVNWLVWNGDTAEIGEALSPLGRSLQAAFRWDAAEQSWDAWSPEWGPLSGWEQLERGDVIAVRLDQRAPKEFFSPSPLSPGPYTVTLRAGENVVAWLGKPIDGAEALASLAAESPRSLSIVWGLNAADGSWDVIYPRPPALAEPGSWNATPLWVRVSQEVVWDQP